MNQRLTQDHQTTLRERLELPPKHLEPEFFLGLEVVIEVAFPAELRALDDVVNRGTLEPLLRDESRGGIHDSIPGVSHASKLGPSGPKTQVVAQIDVSRSYPKRYA